MKEDTIEQFNRILVATNFTRASTAAMEKAIKMARDNGAELLIAHAYHPPSLIQAESVAPGVYEEWDQNLQTDVEKTLQPLVEGARRQLVDARPLVLHGSPYQAITEAAKRHNVDLIIVGTRGRTGASRFLPGSVAARVISTAPCPVMTIRADSAAVTPTPRNPPARFPPAGSRRLRLANGKSR